MRDVKCFYKNVKSILTPACFDDRITSALTEQMRKSVKIVYGEISKWS